MHTPNTDPAAVLHPVDPLWFWIPPIWLCGSRRCQVRSWVAEAAGEDRERLQWQKYEDTTLGYWLQYAPFARQREPARLALL